MWSPGPHDDLGGTDLKMGTRMGEGGLYPRPHPGPGWGGLFGFISGTPILNFLGTFFSKTGHFRLFARPFWTSKNRFF